MPAFEKKCSMWTRRGSRLDGCVSCVGCGGFDLKESFVPFDMGAPFGWLEMKCKAHNPPFTRKIVFSLRILRGKKSSQSSEI